MESARILMQCLNELREPPEKAVLHMAIIVANLLVGV